MLLALALSLSLSTAPDPAFASDAQQGRSSYVADCAASQRRSELGLRLQSIRQRVAERRASELELARQMRRTQDLRPFSPDVLGSHARRQRLGQREIASLNDARLGSLARRQIYSGSVRPQPPRPRR